MIYRAVGEGRYAREEREQRWVLRTLPDGLDQPVAIVDRYIRGTRLRLRRMETITGKPEVVFKLGQKIRPEPEKPDVVKLTNMYLTAAEYDVLASLAGGDIRKTRWRWASQRPVVVDEFSGALVGLILAEIELSPGETRRLDPPLTVADVTDDDRFSGGTLSGTSAAEMTGLLASFDLPVR
jgi:CYTH domain-containing protein